jgi:type 1 glutamine amidotransferase
VPSQTNTRQALVVRGGWDGHVPVESTDAFIPFLKENGFEVTVSDSLDVYTDADLMSATDLVLQCWTMGQISKEQSQGLIAAVRAGTGLAGWHGGIVDSFRADVHYLWLTGGQFLDHPGGQIDYEVQVTSDDPIVAGIDRISVHSEQYWVATDGLNEVLATTTFQPGPETQWQSPVTVPVIWKRLWGKGKVFVNTVGHTVADLEIPEIRTTIERGLLWASR